MKLKVRCVCIVLLEHQTYNQFGTRKHSEMIQVLLVAALFTWGVSTGTHSLFFFYTAVSEGVPEFFAESKVDDVQIFYYDSSHGQVIPRQDWANDSAHPQYWEILTHNFNVSQQTFSENVRTLMKHSNQTKGTHTVQMMYGCQLNENGTTRAIMQLGFDGEDFLTFNKETLNWTTTVQHVVPFQEERQAQEAQNRQVKLYLETTCIESLKVLLKHGKETLERKAIPDMALTERINESSTVTEVSCHVSGFYPPEVEVRWVSDGQRQLEDSVQSGMLLPNQDGTYQLRKTLMLYPEELRRDNYFCQVEHSSFPNTRILKWEPRFDSDNGGPNVWLIAVVCGVGILLVGLVLGVVWMVRKKKNNRRNSATVSKQQETSEAQEMLYVSPH
ncbi:class I histocompatibility antigen, F10 alpha chain-like isoform X1 [Acipenser ruthenus]|uniref:class I histocompatibility antigen, F10 alpha chain-like isoform X1 n=1 Tax=Acipenser ruthenus TaxID=7906 RepID=UPI0015605B54|nr:class I histocompatibility antigen, F10 alpha chain-like isoform X1 [Acipenser ruthenus]